MRYPCSEIAPLFRCCTANTRSGWPQHTLQLRNRLRQRTAVLFARFIGRIAYRDYHHRIDTPRAAGTAPQTPPDRNCRSSNSPNPVQQPPDRYVRQRLQHLYRHGHARRTAVSTKHSDLPEPRCRPVPSTASRDRNSAEVAPAPLGSGQRRNAMADGSRPTAPGVHIRVCNRVSTARPPGPSNAEPNGAPPQVP